MRRSVSFSSRYPSFDLCDTARSTDSPSSPHASVHPCRLDRRQALLRSPQSKGTLHPTSISSVFVICPDTPSACLCARPSCRSRSTPRTSSRCSPPSRSRSRPRPRQISRRRTSSSGSGRPEALRTIRLRSKENRTTGRALRRFGLDGWREKAEKEALWVMGYIGSFFRRQIHL